MIVERAVFSSMPFQDHFSSLAEIYARHRPGYPSALFEYLAGLAPGRDLAWDCGTGSGQAATALVEHFARVVATDASREQLAEARPHERIEYRTEPAERVSLLDSSVDLVTVAVAIHWFDLEPFYAEVGRVLKPGGVVAAWTYQVPRVDDGVNRLLQYYYKDLLGPYWPPRFHYVEENYRTLPFPFEEIEPPTFEMTTEWNLDQLAGFLSSWSGAQRYQMANGRHPLEKLWHELATAWGAAASPRLMRWPLHLRVGRNL